MKTLLLKLLLGTAVVAALQLPVGWLLRERDQRDFDQVQRAISARGDVLVLGDSVLDFATRREPATLLDRIREALPGVRVEASSGPGRTPEMYRAILQCALRQGQAPRAVVLPVNLRILSELFDRAPQYQFSELRARLRFGDWPAVSLQRPFASWEIYAILEGYPRTLEAAQRVPIVRHGRRVGTLESILALSGRMSEPDARRLAFEALYQVPLASSHRKVRTFADIAALCRSAGIPLFAYVTPLDLEAGVAAAGPEFRAQVAGNIDVIRGALAAQGAGLTDWSALLPSDRFFYEGLPNEHLTDGGRKRLAEEIAGLLRSAGIR